MLSSYLRFHGRRSVLRVLQKGKPSRGAYLQIKTLKTYRDSYRVGVVVSKKVSKSAVVRNRIRRVIYEAVRKEKLLEGRKMDVLIFVHNVEIGSWPYERLVSELRDILSPAIQGE